MLKCYERLWHKNTFACATIRAWKKPWWCVSSLPSINITQDGRSGQNSPVPSSEAIPSPSALFCLSNAFKSRTLTETERAARHQNGPLCGLGGCVLRRTYWLWTCMTAWVPTDFWKSLRPFSLSGNQAFSAMEKNRERINRSNHEHVEECCTRSCPKHPLKQRGRRRTHGNRRLSGVWSVELTCWTCTLPPLRTEMPSLRVQVTMGPRRPGTHTHTLGAVSPCTVTEERL